MTHPVRRSFVTRAAGSLLNVIPVNNLDKSTLSFRGASNAREAGIHLLSARSRGLRVFAYGEPRSDGVSSRDIYAPNSGQPLRRATKSSVSKGAPCRIAIAVAALLFAACAQKEDGTLAGYVEADLIYLAPQDAGVVKTLNFREGDKVKAGDIVFTLDPTRFSIAAEQAGAAAAGATARVADEGMMAKQIAEAEAALTLAEKSFRRSKDLVKDGAVSREKYDTDAAAYAAAKARLDGARAERDAMVRDRDSMAAAARLAERRLTDLETSAPRAGTIERVYRRPGEVAAFGDPVVALLAPENFKLKFFAPEAMLSSLTVGGKIEFSCDGCTSARAATISYIASEPQFTPPVIYSIKEREKLVFLVEARPDDPDGLRPGLPVTIVPR